jgi:tetratricopeptide (TPR) repeat protein
MAPSPTRRAACILSVALAATRLLPAAALVPVALPAQSRGAADYAAAKDAAARRSWDAAAAAMERAVQASPADAEYRYWLGKAYAGQAAGASPWVAARLTRKAIHAMERSIALDPTQDAAYAEVIPAYARLPRVLGGDRARAEALLARWLRIRPYAAGLARVRFDVARNLPEQALTDATALASAFPDSARAHYELALAYQRASRFAESWRVIDRGLVRWPDDPRLLFALGRAAAETGERVAPGELALRRVGRAGHGVDDALRANARYRLGRILERRGDSAGARAEYDAALALAPALRDARAARERLR